MFRPSLTPLSPSHLPSSRPRTSLIVEALIASLMHLNLDDVWLVLLCFNAGACRVQGLAQLLLAVLLGFMKNLFLLVQASVLEGLVDFCERSRESRDIMFLLYIVGHDSSNLYSGQQRIFMDLSGSLSVHTHTYMGQPRRHLLSTPSKVHTSNYSLPNKGQKQIIFLASPNEWQNKQATIPSMRVRTKVQMQA
ncbi:hypothetical protein AAZX31_08G287900 [Glycine max]